MLATVSSLLQYGACKWNSSPLLTKTSKRQLVVDPRTLSTSCNTVSVSRSRRVNQELRKEKAIIESWLFSWNLVQNQYCLVIGMTIGDHFYCCSSRKYVYIYRSIRRHPFTHKHIYMSMSLHIHVYIEAHTNISVEHITSQSPHPFHTLLYTHNAASKSSDAHVLDLCLCGSSRGGGA